MTKSSNDLSGELAQLIVRRRYGNLKEYVLKHFPVSDPFDIIHKTGLSYLDAFTSRYISSLDDDTLMTIEELNLGPECIIALKPAAGRLLKAALDNLKSSPNEFRSPGSINSMVMDLRETTEDNVLFSFDRYDLFHIGKKAYEFHRINMKGRNLLFNVGKYVMSSREFKSGKQRRYFLDTLRRIHRSRVLEEPCKSEDKPCERCESCNSRLEVLLGPPGLLEEDE